MADALKTFFSPALVRQLADSVVAVHPRFPAKAFVGDATRGLAALELVARARHIAEALHAHLPSAYPDAIGILTRSLGDEHASDELEGAGMAPFFYLPHTIYVANYGLDDFELSMNAQHEITRRFTCEFSIRAFLERYPDQTLAVLRRFAIDPNPHVRRLVSEGTRPRLPWATRVSWLEAQPERVLPLLEALRDDPASVVRRSVANHLNDLAKTQPELVCDIAARWLDDATPERRALVAHALRSLVKRGHRRALALLGFGATAQVTLTDIQFAPQRVHIGQKTRVTFTVTSTAARAQTLAIDLAVHFVKASGKASPKVFKVTTLTLGKRESVTLSKLVSLAVHTTRTPQLGRHLVQAIVNGQEFALGAFDVVG